MRPLPLGLDEEEEEGDNEVKEEEQGDEEVMMIGEEDREETIDIGDLPLSSLMVDPSKPSILGVSTPSIDTSGILLKL